MASTDPIERVAAQSNAMAIARRMSGRRQEQGQQQRRQPNPAPVAATPAVKVSLDLSLPVGLTADERVLYTTLLRETAGNQALALSILQSMRRRAALHA
jgi:hypothetical protein